MEKLHDIYLWAMKAFLIRKADVELFEESPMNFIVDIDDCTGGQTIGNVKSLVSKIVQEVGSSIDSSLTKFVTASLCNILSTLSMPIFDKLQKNIELLALQGWIVKGSDEAQSLGVVCASLSILCNLSHVTPLRDDLSKLIETSLELLLTKMNPSSNKILVTYVLTLYKKHIGDFFLESSEKFDMVIRLLCLLLTQPQSSGSLFATESVLTAMMGIYKEGSSEALIVAMEGAAPKLLSALVQGLGQAQDLSYFDCLTKYVNVFKHTLNQLSLSDQQILLEAVGQRIKQEIGDFKLEGSKILDCQDHTLLFNLTGLLGDIFISIRSQLHNLTLSTDPILNLFLSLLKDSHLEIEGAFIDAILDVMRLHISSIKLFTKIHKDFLCYYILGGHKSTDRSLHEGLCLFYSAYLYHGFSSFPEECRDRFIVEILMTINYNLKRRKERQLGLEACRALVLAQCLVANYHEFLTRSQVEEIVVSAVQSIQDDRRSQTVLGIAFSTLNACLVYVPINTLQTLQTREFFLEFVGLLNKKLITICQTPHDTKLLVIGLISILRHTMGSPPFSRVDHLAVFKFVFLLLDYHLLTLDLNVKDPKMSLETQIKYGNLQKDIMHLDLVREGEGTQKSGLTEEMDREENETDEYDGEYRTKKERLKAAVNNNDVSLGSEEYEGSESLEASDLTDEFCNVGYDERHYKMMIKRIESPIAEIDEFQYFRDFIIQLRANYSESLKAIVTGLNDKEHESFRSSLWVRRVGFPELGPGRPQKQEFRKVYTIQRVPK